MQCPDIWGMRVDLVEGGGGGLEGVLEEYLGLFLAVDLFIGLLVREQEDRAE